MLTFQSSKEHQAWLAENAALPQGFRCGSVAFQFTPVELQQQATMRLTLITVDKPTPDFALMFTRNAFCGAPVIVGRKRLLEPTLAAVLINNKISNVCAPQGVEASSALCDHLAPLLGLKSEQVLPSSTGIIGWQLPVQSMIAELPALTQSLQNQSILPAAKGMMTTDLYPKIRRVQLKEGSIVAIAKGAGMIEPNLATMLVYILTDIQMPREILRAHLAQVVSTSFNAISIDSDQSTSDMVALLSSGYVKDVSQEEFLTALQKVCSELACDVVRNGEGVHHVMQTKVLHAPSEQLAKEIGKSVVNSPLWQTAVCGNDPNIGRLVMAIGKCLGNQNTTLDISATKIYLGKHLVFKNGEFLLNEHLEKQLIAYFKETELYQSITPKDGVYRPPIDYPPHERVLEITIDLAAGNESFTVWGSDRSHEYISENADYRS